MLKGFLLVTATVSLLCGSFFGRALPSQKAEAGAAANPGSLGRAEEIYRRDCLVCHGVNGDGKTGIARDRDLVLPDWTDPKSLAGRPDQQLFHIIRYGKGKMPAESPGRADDAEVRDLIRYIRGMAKDGAAAPVFPKKE